MSIGPERPVNVRVPVTALVAVLMIDTVFAPAFVTYASVPAWFTATPYGKLPTGIVATTALVVRLTTETLFPELFATYA
jgi:hypothetical protein